MHISYWARLVRQELALGTILVVFLAGTANAAPAWEAVLNENVGFGGNTTGGAGGQLITVTNLNDSGSGSLREALAVPGATWIRFLPGLDGTISSSSQLKVLSNTTIDGRGANVTIDFGNTGYGMYLYDRSNIIVMYLRLQRSGHDLIHLRNGFSDGWIHHVTFGVTDDEQLSIRNGADDITVSWCKFDNGNKGALLRAQSEEESFESQYSHVTLHHNFWNSVAQRTPKLGNVGHYHIFNDYVFEWDYTGVKAIKNGQVFIESGIFEPKSGAPTSKQLQAATPFESNVADGLMKLEDNLLMGGAYATENRPEDVFVPPYSYSKDPANQSTRDSIIASAGWQDVPFPDAIAQQPQPAPPGAFAAQ